MNRIKLKETYRKGEIAKADYIDEMYANNQALFDYMHLLKGTDITSIEINENEVVFTSRKDGIKISCQKPDKRTAPFEIMNFDDYESNDADFLFKFIKDGDTIFDIGSNIGWYSISLAKRYLKSSIYSFEPLPSTYASFINNISLNKVNNISAYNFGFSGKDDILEFFSSPHTSVSNSSQNISGETEASIVRCEVKKMDTFYETLNTPIDFLKCDVEGAELFVFQGAVDTLKKNQPIVFTEMLRKWAAKFGYHPNDIIRLFAEIGYECYYGENDKLRSIDVVNDATTATNFFFLHPDKHRSIIETYLNK